MRKRILQEGERLQQGGRFMELGTVISKDFTKRTVEPKCTYTRN